MIELGSATVKVIVFVEVRPAAFVAVRVSVYVPLVVGSGLPFWT